MTNLPIERYNTDALKIKIEYVQINSKERFLWLFSRGIWL